MKKLVPEILPTDKDPGIYDLVILGTPVWGWSLASPLRAYVLKNKGKFKRVAFFCTMGGSGHENAFAELKSICEKNPLALLGLKKDEVLKKGYSTRLKDFADEISNSFAAGTKEGTEEKYQTAKKLKAAKKGKKKI
jgi:hypothetical protein